MRWRIAVALTLIISVTATHAESPLWVYSSTLDAMTSQPIRFATTRSLEELQFHTPYEGPQHATLIIRNHPREGTTVILAVERGRFVCTVSGCRLLVRFDDAPAVSFDAFEPTDGSSNGLFLRPVGQFLQLVRTSHRVIVEGTFYQEGSRAIEFATQGLEWEPTKEERAYSAAAKFAAARRAVLARCQPDRASPPTFDCITEVRYCDFAYGTPGLTTSGNLVTALKCLDAVGRHRQPRPRRSLQARIDA
jgi:hypothetical protein